MRLALAYARTETVQLARYPAYSLPTLLFPALLLLVFGGRLGGSDPTRLMVGFGATALLTVAFFQFGVGIATSRATPWESYLRTLPAGALTRLAGKVMSSLAFAGGTVAVVAMVATVVFDARMAPWRFGVAVLALLLGSVPFALLGIAFGYWLPPRAALPFANIAFVPLVVGGALWARPSDIPHRADVASQTLPTRSWVEVLDSIATGDQPVPLHHIGALAAWSLAFGLLAWWGYRRDEGERFR